MHTILQDLRQVDCSSICIFSSPPAAKTAFSTRLPAGKLYTPGTATAPSTSTLIGLDVGGGSRNTVVSDPDLQTSRIRPALNNPNRTPRSTSDIL